MTDIPELKSIVALVTGTGASIQIISDKDQDTLVKDIRYAAENNKVVHLKSFPEPGKPPIVENVILNPNQAAFLVVREYKDPRKPDIIIPKIGLVRK